MSGVPVYRELLLWARPPRVATFVPSGDLTAAFRMMENYSQTWAGQGNIIVPFAGLLGQGTGEIPEMDGRFSPIVSAFDPDHLGIYNWTPRGYEMANPQGFAAYLRRQAEQLVEKHGGSVEEFERQLREDHIHRSVGAPLQLAPGTLRWAERRLACFGRHSHAVLTTHEKAEEDPNSELLSIAARLGEPIVRIVTPDLTAFSAETQLMAAACLGSISPRYEDHLANNSVEVVRPAVDEEHLSAFLTAAMTGSPDQLSFSVTSALRRETGEPERPTPEYLSEGFFGSTPFACTMRGAAQVHLASIEWVQRPLPVIVGSGIADFCLAIAADRLLGGALWLPVDPTTPLNDEQQAITTGVVRAINALAGKARQRHVRFLTMSDIDVETAGACLRDHQLGMRWTADDQTGTALWSIPSMRVVGRDDWYQSRAVPFLDQAMATRLEPLVPAFADTDDVWAVRWIAEASIEGFKAPRRSAVAACLAEADEWERGAVRASADGISFASHRMGLVLGGSPIRDALARPRLQMPHAKRIVDALLDMNGLHAEPSAAGLYTSGTLDLWGGLESLASDLTDPAARAVLDAYSSPDSDAGCRLDAAGRRFLTITDMEQVSGAEPPFVRSLIDRLVGRQVLRRGLLLKCSRCLYLGWYAAEAIGQRFTCGRCSTNQTIVLDSWRSPVEEPSWFYDLAEVTYQALVHNAHIPVLTLASLKRDGRGRPFDFTTDLDIFRDDARIDEIDFVAVANGEVLVGEAKKGTTLTDGGTEREERRAVAKLVEAADGMTADTIIVATASPTFGQATLNHLQNEAERRGIALRLMVEIGGATNSSPEPPG